MEYGPAAVPERLDADVCVVGAGYAGLTVARRLSGERRNLPMVEIEKDYIFDGPKGSVRLIDMFGGRPQLVVYYFVVDSDWEDSCPSCTAGTDELSSGFFEHLHTWDTSCAMVSRAPLAKLERWETKRGWDRPLRPRCRRRLPRQRPRHASPRSSTSSSSGQPVPRAPTS